MGDTFIPLNWVEYPLDEMQRRAGEFYAELARRRSVRAFSPRPVPRRIIEDCLRAAGSAPSGANMQPWHFCAVSDRAVKRQIRQAAEACERAFYAGKASDEWLDALSPLGTGPQKPFLEDAPWLIAVFSQRYGIDTEGNKIQHYYVTESVGIAIGMLIAALHHAGLATLTYTPAPVTFLRDLLGRPENERPLMILVAGYPAENARVPKIEKKSLDQVVTWRESTH